MKIVRSILLMVFAGFVSGSALAAENGTKDEAKAMVEAAVAHISAVGADKAFKDFEVDKAKWTNKDLYVYVFDDEGNCLSHGVNPKMVGKNFKALKDAQGRSFILEMAKVAKTGGGWFDYDWAHPATKKVLPKTAYLVPIDGGKNFVGVGAYR